MLKSTAKVKHKTDFPASRDLRAFDKSAKRAPQVRVGFPAVKTGGVKYPDGTSVISVGFWQEFGTKRIPQRSFLRSTMIEKRSEYRNALRRSAKKALRGTDLIGLCKRLGLAAVGDVQAKITAIKTPPNSPSAIKIKGSANPLIDTGFLRSSVTYELRTGQSGKSKKN